MLPGGNPVRARPRAAGSGASGCIRRVWTAVRGEYACSTRVVRRQNAMGTPGERAGHTACRAAGACRSRGPRPHGRHRPNAGRTGAVRLQNAYGTRGERPSWWDRRVAIKSERWTRGISRPTRPVPRTPGPPIAGARADAAFSRTAPGLSAPVQPDTETVEETARRYGIGRGMAYDLARRGELPGVIRLGRRFVVAKAVTDRVLGEHGPDEVCASGDPAGSGDGPMSGIRAHAKESAGAGPHETGQPGRGVSLERVREHLRRRWRWSRSSSGRGPQSPP